MLFEFFELGHLTNLLNWLNVTETIGFKFTVASN